METLSSNCSEQGCSERRLARGLCRRHYNRWHYREGHPDCVQERSGPRPAQVVCRACSTPVATKPNGPTPKYCSRRCKDWSAKHPGVPLPAPRACKWCGNEVTTSSPRISYCSLRCGQIARGEILYGPRQQLQCANADCGEPFLKVWPRQRCCSERCGKRRWATQAKADGRTYSEPWNDRRRDRYHRRRAQKKATSTGEPVLRDAIGDRDKWRCSQCRRKVNRNLAYPHPMSPSIDHVIPLSKGGPHTPENAKITHLRCNLSKGDRGGAEQLMLIG